MKTPKQDRQGVRTPADIERKYDLGNIGGGGTSSADMSKLISEINSLKVEVNTRLNAIESGWTPNVYIGSDENGKLTEKPAPTFDLTEEQLAVIIEAVLESFPNGDEVSY